MKLLQLSACLGLVASAWLQSTDAHSFLVKPQARTNEFSTVTRESPGCPRNRVGKVTSYEAGETIDVRYWRNNHIGGFIRWSIAPRGNESKQEFDQNTFYYTCRESGPECRPRNNPDKPIAGDGSGDNTIPCGDRITLPDWLPAGDYVLQWTWFGVGHSFGNVGWAEPQFRSCADIKLTSSGSKKKPACPRFVGGDRVTKAQNKGSNQCFYFYTNDIVSTIFKGDNNNAMPNYKFGVPAEVEKCGGGGGDDGNNEDGSQGGDNTTAPSTQAPAPSKGPDASASAKAAAIDGTRRCPQADAHAEALQGKEGRVEPPHRCGFFTV
ncbi:hypothetical protein PINS_up008798 [Pythium insidiosum]|nr:hypothetical protein PINS_up008798 [Pythium insidiosum]